MNVVKEWSLYIIVDKDQIKNQANKWKHFALGIRPIKLMLMCQDKFVFTSSNNQLLFTSIRSSYNKKKW